MLYWDHASLQKFVTNSQAGTGVYFLAHTRAESRLVVMYSTGLQVIAAWRARQLVPVDAI